MSDISIPGVAGSSKYNTSEIIEKLMDAERIPLIRMNKEVTELEERRGVWQTVNRHIVALRSSSKFLWSFENPFNDRVAISSDEKILTAVASRKALQEKLEFTVIQTAKSDKFITDSMEKNYKVPAGTYRFVIDEKEVKINYRGGKLKNFAEIINDKAGKYLKANVIRNTADTYIFSLEGIKTGTENQIFFADDAVDFGISTGMLKHAEGNDYNFSLSKNDVKPWNSASVNSKNVIISDDKITLETGADFRLPIPEGLKLEENFVLEYTIEVRNTINEFKEPTAPPGPDETTLNPLSFEGITVYGQNSMLELPDWIPPERPSFVSDLNIMYAESNGSIISLPKAADTDGPVTKKITIGKTLNNIDSLNFRNRNTDRTIIISNIKIYDPTVTGEYAAKNQVNQSMDSIIEIDGIEVTRPGNVIDDLVPEVTLTLKRASEESVELSIEPDREAVKNSIIQFVFDYNTLLEDLQVITNNEEAVIDEIFALTDEEREEKMKILGMFSGDITFMQMKSKLQQIMMNTYPTSDDEVIKMLAQIGISTNSSGGGFDMAKLRGYLEINEEELDRAMENDMDLIKELFSFDTNNDLSMDTGVAFLLDTYLNTYVRIGGVIADRLKTINQNLERKNDGIDDFEEKMEIKEAQLRREYGMMEGALNSLESSSKALDGFMQKN